MTRAALIVVGILIAHSCLADEPMKRQWKVGDEVREALVVVPASAKTSPAPVIFVFHGHGGTAAHAAGVFGCHKLWPEAVVVYPQGLKTPGRLTDPQGKKTGWQHSAGDQADRDLKFFDAMLAGLKDELKIDAARVYATGHSNGGSFTYLLWANRSDAFAAVAPSAAPAGRSARDLRPKPVMHIAGENDELVKFAWQKRTIDALLALNGCDAEGKNIGKHCTLHASKSGNPVVAFIHPGTHKFPDDAPAAIVKFFKEHSRK